MGEKKVAPPTPEAMATVLASGSVGRPGGHDLAQDGKLADVVGVVFTDDVDFAHDVVRTFTAVR